MPLSDALDGCGVWTEVNSEFIENHWQNSGGACELLEIEEIWDIQQG